MRRRVALLALAFGVATWWVGPSGPAVPAVALSNDTDVTFSVTQAPAAPRVVQAGTTVTFTVEATANVGLSSLFFEFDYPDGLTFLGGSSDPLGVGCSDDTPSEGVVRCDYGAVVAGALVPLELVFRVDADATSAPDQFRMRAGVSDGQPDTASDGDEEVDGLGALEVFQASDFDVSVVVDRTSTFERADVIYSATLTNQATNGTGAFEVELALTNGVASEVACDRGTPEGTNSATARCAGVDLAGGESLTMTVRATAADTEGGDDLGAQLTAPAVGIGRADVDEPTVTVHEVGLLRTTGEPAIGEPVTVCTGEVAEDVAGERAAGAAQPNDVSRLRGTFSGSAVLQAGDFEVSGPAASEPSEASGCGTDQSGITFIPSEAGTYVVTVRYNFGGTNVLEVSVGGEPTPMAPTPSEEIQPERPVPGALVARSRVSFVVGTGGLAAESVRLVIVRSDDGRYWDAQANSWSEARVENAAVEGADGWELAVTGAQRRSFNDVRVSIEVVVETEDGLFTNATAWDVQIR